ncbi:MobP2 family relaxase [Lactobacillus sp. ESL0681]|uniref:MobP2 family relaxase n=1 Tax=Lactobacillus sp. ESL0681 TaxID=2983211 RepID=UPI0023F8B710|nr:MobP2 family relaxase [Lactobacillus sp. ESL0681]WEV41282.1 relaxase MobL [Lactobacillus sp. ESL0681]
MRPGIILTSKFTTSANRQAFGSYVSYMTRKEALDSKKYLTTKEEEELDLVEKNLHKLDSKYQFNRTYKEEDSKRASEAEKVLNKKSFWSLDDTNFGNYLGYMSRIQALENKKIQTGNLSKSEIAELARVTDSKNNLLQGKATKDKTLDATFTIDQDNIQLKDMGTIRNILNKAQEKNSVLWQDVVSFDNNFLKKHHLMDSETGTVDTVALKKASRKMMATFQNKMDPPLNDIYWLASIHYNTDNIHLHFATVERDSRREIINRDGIDQPKGRRPQSVIDAMKSSFANDLLNTSDLTRELSQERQRIRHAVKESFTRQIEQPDLQTQINKFMQTLSADRRDWSYNKLNRQQKVNINKIVDGLLSDNSDFNNWKINIKQIQKNRQELYGQSKRDNKDYAQNQMYGKEGIYARCGNALLSDLRKIDRVANGRQRHRINLKDKVPADQYIQAVLKEIKGEIKAKSGQTSATYNGSKTSRQLKIAKHQTTNSKIRLPTINKYQLRKLKSHQELVFDKGHVTKEKRAALREYDQISKKVERTKTE